MPNSRINAKIITPSCVLFLTCRENKQLENSAEM
jgi:hypothetical protein